VIASVYWDKVDNRAFTSAVAVSLVFFLVARFQLIPIEGAVAVVLEVFSAVGAGVVLGLMAFGFLGKRIGLSVAVTAALALVWPMLGFLRDYPVLLSSLNGYGVSTLVCVALSLRNRKSFDFDLIAKRVTSFHDEDSIGPVTTAAATAMVNPDN